MYQNRGRPFPVGFTLVELLVIIAIISLLISIILWALDGLMEVSRNVKCMGNLRQWGTAELFYMADLND